AIGVNAVHLKTRLGDVETDCLNCLHVWLLSIVGALTAPTFMALARRWRSRPQHQKRTLDVMMEMSANSGGRRLIRSRNRRWSTERLGFQGLKPPWKTAPHGRRGHVQNRFA